MLYTYACAAILYSWVCVTEAFFKYADDDGGYKYCWTLPFQRPYEPYQAREQAIEALKSKLNASFCDISYINTIDPWLKHNQTRYKLFIISEYFKDKSVTERHNKVKEIVQQILNNPGDSRVEIVANTLEEKPAGSFTEDEMKYIVSYLDAEQMPIFGGNRIKRDILEYHYSTMADDMSWKFHPNKTCQLVEEIIRKKFSPTIFKCESMHDELRGRVGPGHEDQYKLLVVSKNFLDQPPLRRTINVRLAIEELVLQQMYKVHMRLKTIQEYEAEKDIESTTNFENYA